mgnify:CR=1 FL=1
MPNYQTGLDSVFQALADPTRRAVLQRLSQGPASVSELAGPFRMAMPSFLQHLRVLEDGGLIRTRKTGRVRICHMESKAMGKAEEWLIEQRAALESRLDRLDDYVNTLKAKEKKNGRRA